MTRPARLLGDVGGTNARFGLVRDAVSPVSEVASLRGNEHVSLQAAARSYLDGLATPARPRRAALALAATIDGATVQMTNSRWLVSSADVAAALGLHQVLLLNDFEALALALPRLAEHEVDWMGAPRPNPGLPMAVIGPGTGLGVGSCVPAGSSWIALAAEGGHVTAAAHDDFEGEILRMLRAQYRHVSAERLLSGLGLPTLHAAVCTVRGASPQTLGAEEITQRAFDQADAHCLATLDVFCAMLGGFAGNVALTVGARGGVFVAGGIAQKLGTYFTTSRFRERFEAKGRFQSYLAGIATGLIAAPHAALAGAAQALAQTRTPQP